MTEELKLIRNNIIKDYQNKMPIEDILDKYNIKWNQLYQLVTPVLNNTRDEFPKDKEKYVI